MPEIQQPEPDDDRPAGNQPLSTDVDPWVIANDPTLDRAAKLERLHQLEQDVRQIAVALEEGMAGESRLPALQAVLAALEHVAGPDGSASSSPTKS
jgi:hypothetical protein